MKASKAIFYLAAFVTVIIWGITFVSTKVIIAHGLSSEEIFIARFGIAYILSLLLCHNQIWADNLKDEILLFMAGVTGGSLYFITENTALAYTFASNVSILICSSPVFTLILGCIFFREKINLRMVAGSLVAFAGVVMVVFNGTVNLKSNPIGDILTLWAALSWAIYGFLLKSLNVRYENYFINRKVFFYGLTSGIIYSLMLRKGVLNPAAMIQLPVILNILFLGVIASFACYMMWNISLKKIGVEITSNFIYLVPFITIATSHVFIDEPLSNWTCIGGLLIVSGIYTSVNSKIETINRKMTM